jgi:hypothetical protein
MVSLWGTKSDEPNQQQNGDNPNPRINLVDEESPSHEPDERTRLLPSNHPAPPPGRDGYLDPDDPAVRTTRHIHYN